MGWKTLCQKAEGSAGQADANALLLNLFKLQSSLQGESMEAVEFVKDLSASKSMQVVA